jgi:hypothetical protein
MFLGAVVTKAAAVVSCVLTDGQEQGGLDQIEARLAGVDQIEAQLTGVDQIETGENLD